MYLLGVVPIQELKILELPQIISKENKKLKM